jgi:TatD DNase family protein
MQPVIVPDSLSVIDIGANLTNASFKNDLADIIQRAKDSHVSSIIVTGTSIEQSVSASQLCEQYPNYLYSTAGCHPHDAKDFKLEDLAAIKNLAAKNQVVAVGECGLDFNRNYSPREIQIKVFRQQLELAADLGLPVFLHQRDAHVEFLSILKEYRPQLDKVVVHCFTEGIEALNDYLEIDCYIGVTGWVCDDKRGEALRQAVALIPDDKLLIETDAPYLLPKTLKPKPKRSRNEPMNLLHVCQAVADIKQQTLEHTAATTYKNSRYFFGI